MVRIHVPEPRKDCRMAVFSMCMLRYPHGQKSHRRRLDSPGSPRPCDSSHAGLVVDLRGTRTHRHPVHVRPEKRLGQMGDEIRFETAGHPSTTLGAGPPRTSFFKYFPTAAQLVRPTKSIRPPPSRIASCPPFP